ncbi:MAG TPA: glycosyltransferase family 87 protein [Terracidiphilus sp.]|nr:glycosyltransferase family 87 protein [Terracidiphilus sp.]
MTLLDDSTLVPPKSEERGKRKLDSSELVGHSMRSEGIEHSQLWRRCAIIAMAISMTTGIDALLAWQVRGPIANGSTDFLAFYTAGQFVSQGNGIGLFTRSPFVSAPFTHAPYEALLFVPLAHFSYPVAAWVWCVLNIIIANLCVFLLLPCFPRVSKRPELAFLAVGMFLPVLIAEFNGQDSLLTLLMLVLCFKALSSHKTALAGCALACACFKPPLAIPMLLLIVATSKRPWVFLRGFIATSCILLLISAKAVGWGGLVQYFRFLRAYAAGPDQYHVYDMPNLRGFITWLFASHIGETILQGALATLSFFALILVIWIVRREDLEFQSQHYALFVTATILVAFHEYSYDLVLLVLPILIIWNSAGSQSSRGNRWMRLAPLVLIIGSVAASLKPPIYTCAIVLLFVLLCWTLSTSRLHSRPHQAAVVA